MLSEQIRGHRPGPVALGKPDEVRDLGELVRAVEVGEIVKALRLCDGNKTRAAEALAISRFALQRKLEKYEIRIDEE